MDWCPVFGTVTGMICWGMMRYICWSHRVTHTKYYRYYIYYMNIYNFSYAAWQGQTFQKGPAIKVGVSFSVAEIAGAETDDFGLTTHMYNTHIIIRQYEHMSDDLNLGWLIHYVSGHRMPKPCKAMGNLKNNTLSLIHHMILWIVIWICLISITAAHPKY